MILFAIISSFVTNELRKKKSDEEVQNKPWGLYKLGFLYRNGFIRRLIELQWREKLYTTTTAITNVFCTFDSILIQVSENEIENEEILTGFEYRSSIYRGWSREMAFKESDVYSYFRIGCLVKSTTSRSQRPLIYPIAELVLT